MLSSQIGVVDDAGHLVGFARFNAMGRYTEIHEGLWLPDDFSLQCPGGPSQPSLLMNFQVRESVPVCVGVAIESKIDGNPTTPRDLTTIADKLNNWQEMVCRAVMQHGRRLSASERVIELRVVDQTDSRRAYGASLSKSRSKITDAMLEEVAALYRDSAKGAAWQAIQDRFGVAPSTAGRYVMRARQANLLPPTTRGKRS